MTRKWPDIVRFAILIVLALLAIFPIFFLLINSTKTQLEFSTNPLAFPTSFEWQTTPGRSTSSASRSSTR